MTRWFDGETPLDELGPSEQIAHRIVQEFGDLAPSVDRIMVAELTEAQRERAMDLFEASLGQVDDVHRDPRNAIAAARSMAD